MLLYWVGDRYVRTQTEARKLGFGEETDIPVDKDGLMEFLNQLKRFHHQDMEQARARISELEKFGTPSPNLTDPDPGFGIPPAPDAVPPVPLPQPRPMDAAAVLSRMDSPGVDVEGVVEAIGSAKGYALKRYAGAVAVRFQELGKL